jgi:transcriptional regulator with XRE-family HTH domain
MKKSIQIIGKKIRAIRKQKGLTQVDLANLLGCSQVMITSYENDSKLPSVTTLIKLSDILNVTVDSLVRQSDHVKTETKKEKLKNPRLWKKFKQIDQLTENDKRTIFRLIDGLLEKQKIGKIDKE